MAFYNLGHVYEITGQLNQAYKNYDKAFSLVENNFGPNYPLFQQFLRKKLEFQKVIFFSLKKKNFKKLGC